MKKKNRNNIFKYIQGESIMKNKLTRKVIAIGILFSFLFSFLFLLSSPIFASSSNIQLEELLQSIIEEKTTITDAYAVINLGNFFFAQQLYPPARDEYYQALQIEPTNKIAHINLSYTFFKMGDFEQALEQLTQLEDNDIAQACYIKGLIYKEQRKLEEAIEQYEKVVELIPNHQELNAELGQLYLDNRQLVKANERFIEMGYCQPRPPIMDKLIAYQANAYCYLHLGNYYRNIGELEKAQQAYQKATQFEGDERSIALAYFYQGEIDLKDHNYDRAILEKELAQKVYPLGEHNFTFNIFAEALLEIGDQYYHNGNLPEAITHYQLATNLANDPAILALAHYKKGLTYYRSQNYENALREAEIALSCNPDYLSDRQRLIDLLIANSWSEITKK